MGIAEYTLNLEIRDAATKADVLRRQGKLPLALYGKGVDPVLLVGDTLNITKTLKRAGESSLVNIKIQGGEDRIVLFKEPQYDPTNGAVMHVDLYQVNLKEKIRAEVPLSFIGEAPAIEAVEGVLVTNRDKIEVECLPNDLPHEIPVDLTGLHNIDDEIKVKDLKLPTGVEVLDDPEELIVIITKQREEEVVEAPVTEEEAVAQVEVTSEKDETSANEASAE
ncbi:MAG: 50S ribosomal protein L25 [Patescibacteria group bacterium]|jgi:large subunit ribosomal protein L25